jgi:hypothetical protein
MSKADNRQRFHLVQLEAKKLKEKNPRLKHTQAVKQAWAIVLHKKPYSKKSEKMGSKKIGSRPKFRPISNEKQTNRQYKNWFSKNSLKMGLMDDEEKTIDVYKKYILRKKLFKIKSINRKGKQTDTYAYRYYATDGQGNIKSELFTQLIQLKKWISQKEK